MSVLMLSGSVKVTKIKNDEITVNKSVRNPMFYNNSLTPNEPMFKTVLLKKVRLSIRVSKSDLRLPNKIPT